MLLTCGTSWSNNPSNIFYGGTPDSVLVSYDDIRAANAKMIELQYEKLKNQNLVQIVDNDSIIIESLKTKVQVEKKAKKKAKTRERIAEGVSFAAIIGLIISLCR